MSDIFKLFDLTGRVAVVTGGAGLLGTEFCQTLSQAGANTIIADIDGEAATAVAASINQRFTGALVEDSGRTAVAFGIKVDVTSPSSVEKLVEFTLDHLKRLDILVNAAVIDPKFDPAHTILDYNPTAFEDLPLKAWQQALEVNLSGMFLCCQASVKPMLLQGKGVIINLCSIYGLVGPDQRIYQKVGGPAKFKPAYYSVTKAGVLGLTHYLATYYGGKGIRVNSLSPGGVFNGHEEAFVQAYSARTVLGRMAVKSDMNGALLFLASDASAYMTGANLVIDGGWTAW